MAEKANKTVAVEVKNLTKKFGDLTAVNDLNFKIFKNEVFGLLGPNGAGKTTTISMICGLLPSTTGSIIFSGYDVSDYKSIIGYCPQENIYYPKLTCFEQLTFIGEMYGKQKKQLKQRAEELLLLMGLKDKTNVRASNLSGGMKRRLNICLALIHDPEILILDEPEAGLDPQSRILVRDFIRNFGKEKTIILTTHNMDEADRLSDRVAVIDYGKLLLLGNPENLKRTIGEGDILELVFENANPESLIQFEQQVSLVSQIVNKGYDSYYFRNNNIIEHISSIKQTAENNYLKIKEFKLRQNTLEDVFISLTGRNLRE
jgi:ABC-2 type transport system ATP-binding protein